MATYKETEWDDWMRRALDGDEAAYRALLQAMRPWLKSYFTRRLKGGDIEDLVQITMMSVHTKRHTYRPQEPFMPWLCAVARHKLIDYVRKSKSKVHVELDEELVCDRLLPSLAHRDVALLLQSLPHDQAEALKLHKLQELSVEEVSHVTGLSASNIKVLVHRGLKKLQALVKGGDE